MIQRLIRALPAYKPEVRIFFLAIFALGFAIDGIYTVILNLFLLRLGYETDFIGVVNAIGLLTFALAALPAGILGTRYTNIRMMKIGLGLIIPAATLLPFVQSVPENLREIWLVVMYAIMMGSFATFFVNGEPYLMNVVDDTRRNSAFALKTALFSLAAFVGSLIGGIVPEVLSAVQQLSLDDPAPYQTALLPAGFVAAIAFLFIFPLRPARDINPDTIATNEPSYQPATAPKANWTMPVIAMIVVMSVVRLFQVAGSATAIVYFNVYMDTELMVSTGVIGLIVALGRLAGVGTAFMVPPLMKRYGNGNVVIGGAIATALCMLPLALFQHPVPAAIGFIGVLAMMSIRYTAFVVYILELVPRVQQSVMSGTGELAGGGSFAMMALGGGIILSLFSFRDLFLVGAGLTLLGTVIFWVHFRQRNEKRKIVPA